MNITITRLRGTSILMMSMIISGNKLITTCRIFVKNTRKSTASTMHLLKNMKNTPITTTANMPNMQTIQDTRGMKDMKDMKIIRGTVIMIITP